MKNVLNGKVVTLFFEGEVNSYTAEGVEKDVFDTLQTLSFESIVLDFENLTYISSAGLRIILKLKQRFKEVSIVNASLDVYDVLQMTGFTSILPVHKALNKIDITGCDIIGSGYFSKVYRINKDTIIKVFKNENTKLEEVERELNMAKQAFVLGIPTAISFDVVRVDNKYGVRFEMLDSISLRDLFLKEKDSFDVLVDKYAALLKTINTTSSNSNDLPSTKALYEEKLAKIQPFLDEKDFTKLKGMVDTIPERKTFVHGDCHVKNIMTQNGELLLIDMDTLSLGHPIFELAAIYATYVAFSEDDPGNSDRFLGISDEMAHDIFFKTVARYMNSDNKEITDKIALVSYLHMLWWNKVNEPENAKRFDGCKGRLLKLLAQYDNLDIGI